MRLVAGKVDQVADQDRHLLHLGKHITFQIGPVLSRNLVLTAGVMQHHQQLNVGAHRCQRRLELMARIRHQLRLTLLGLLQRPHQGVDRRGHLRKFVVALHRKFTRPTRLVSVVQLTVQPAHRSQAHRRNERTRNPRHQAADTDNHQRCRRPASRDATVRVLCPRCGNHHPIRCLAHNNTLTVD